MTSPTAPPGTDASARIHDLIASHCFTRALPREYVERIVEHATVRAYPDGAVLFDEGASADEFHLVVDGRVAVEMYSPGRGTQIVDTVDPCETVGWSWLVPPYRWFFTARAMTDTTVVTVDAVALRALADHDPAFGYALLQQVAGVMLERMHAARVQLVDLYGTGRP